MIMIQYVVAVVVIVVNLSLIHLRNVIISLKLIYDAERLNI